MRRMRFLHPPRRVGEIDQDAALLDLDWKCRNAIVLGAGLALAGAAVELPAVPRAPYESGLVERAFAQGPADVIACIGDGAEHAVPIRERDVRAPHFHRLAGMLGELVGSADVDPFGFTGHGRISSRRVSLEWRYLMGTRRGVQSAIKGGFTGMLLRPPQPAD